VEIDHAELEYPMKACGKRNRILPHGVEQRKYQTDVEVDEALGGREESRLEYLYPALLKDFEILAPSHFSSEVPGEE
jgi:hypothetical protein